MKLSKIFFVWDNPTRLIFKSSHVFQWLVCAAFLAAFVVKLKSGSVSLLLLLAAVCLPVVVTAVIMYLCATKVRVSDDEVSLIEAGHMLAESETFVGRVEMLPAELDKYCKKHKLERATCRVSLPNDKVVEFPIVIQDGQKDN